MDEIEHGDGDVLGDWQPTLSGINHVENRVLRFVTQHAPRLVDARFIVHRSGMQVDTHMGPPRHLGQTGDDLIVVVAIRRADVEGLACRRRVCERDDNARCQVADITQAALIRGSVRATTDIERLLTGDSDGLQRFNRTRNGW